LSTTNPTWTDPGANPGLDGERTATNHFSHGTASFYIKTSTESVSKMSGTYLIQAMDNVKISDDEKQQYSWKRNKIFGQSTIY
jgi:hypothetical protein